MLQPPTERNRQSAATGPGRLLMTQFTKDMSIAQALERHPDARLVFERHGMACCLCIGAQLESIESGSIMHAVDPDEVVGELNQLAESSVSD
jgi:hybrid cluster-associated redox disulfide protein